MARRKEKKVPKHCRLCREGIGDIDYKDVITLKRFLTSRGKILSRSKTGICARHQRSLARAVKRARYVALISYTEQHAL